MWFTLFSSVLPSQQPNGRGYAECVLLDPTSSESFQGAAGIQTYIFTIVVQHSNRYDLLALKNWITGRDIILQWRQVKCLPRLHEPFLGFARTLKANCHSCSYASRLAIQISNLPWDEYEYKGLHSSLKRGCEKPLRTQNIHTLMECEAEKKEKGVGGDNVWKLSRALVFQTCVSTYQYRKRVSLTQLEET